MESFIIAERVEEILKTACLLAGHLDHRFSSRGYLLIASNEEKGSTREEAAILLLPIGSVNGREFTDIKSLWNTEGILLFNNLEKEVVLTERETAGGLRARGFILVVKGFTPEENEAIVLLIAAKLGFLPLVMAKALANERKNEVFQDLRSYIR
ncbi:MAG: hypothetical protein ABIH38_02870 [Patescibacteria group bacterium]